MTVIQENKIKTKLACIT